MRREEREQIDPNQPALVVTYGHTSRKHRPLEGELILLGRLPSCDIHLVSPDVAPVHCVLARQGTVWRLRDCSGRPGTLVNGRLVQDALLEDGDVVQIGTFSFAAHLPPLPAPVDPVRVHLEQSRRRLAQRALTLRNHLRTRQADLTEESRRLQEERSELNRQVESLQTRQRDFELRMTRLELSERDLATDRATLDKEYRALQQEQERHEHEVTEFQRRTAASEKSLEQRRKALVAEAEALRAQSPPQPEPTGTENQPPEPEEPLSRAEAFIKRQQAEIDRLIGALRDALSLVPAAPRDQPERSSPSTRSGRRQRVTG
jgi:pSer/pThr/pTyr-binding forkhead associated (FHA) protein